MTFKDWLDEYLDEHPKFAERWRKNAPQRELRKQFLRARINMKMTQADLAKKSGVSVGTILRMESGEGMPQVAKMVRILDAMGYEIIIRQKAWRDNEIVKVQEKAARILEQREIG